MRVGQCDLILGEAILDLPRRVMQLLKGGCVSFHVLCFPARVHCCGCLARACVWLAVTGCWAVGLGGGRAVWPQFRGGDFGSAS